jgi:hypothetical protein
MSDFLESIKYNVGMGFVDFLNAICDKLEKVVENTKVDEAIIETLPRKLVEKKRKTRLPAEGIFTYSALKNIEVTEDQIKVHRILDGFDETLIQAAKERIVDACKFILGNAETESERHIAKQLAKMLWKGAVIITDADLVLDKQIMGCFYTKEDIPYIGLDISKIQKSDDAILVDVLVHEAYHVWRYFTSGTEYSIIDEKRAWNIALSVSNKYRSMYGIPIEKEKEYTEEDLMIELFKNFSF